MSDEAVQQLWGLMSGELSDEARERVARFYAILIRENNKQNLTKLISPQDFKDFHLADVLEMHRTGWLSGTFLDLGSGCGVPGLLSAVIEPRSWVLVESEKRKAEFLQQTVLELGLEKEVRVLPERVEQALKRQPVAGVVARAVGTVEKIYSWLSPCSTWNKLLLLKGPKWEEEWEQFGKSKWRGRLQLEDTHSYQITPGGPQRKIVKLGPVSRASK